MSQMYVVGQVLYVVLSKKNQVYPMQVIEVITKKTLQGEDTQYVLQAGPDKKKTVMLDKIEGEIFETPEKARHILVLRATSQINKLVDLATSKSHEWYNVGSSSPQMIEDLPDLTTKISSQSQTEIEESSEKNQDSLSDEPMTVMLPDGTVAKLKMPSI